MTVLEFQATIASAKILASKLRPCKTALLVDNTKQYLLDNGIKVSTESAAMFILGTDVGLEPIEVLNLIDIIELSDCEQEYASDDSDDIDSNDSDDYIEADMDLDDILEDILTD